MPSILHKDGDEKSFQVSSARIRKRKIWFQYLDPFFNLNMGLVHFVNPNKKSEYVLVRYTNRLYPRQNCDGSGPRSVFIHSNLDPAQQVWVVIRSGTQLKEGINFGYIFEIRCGVHLYNWIKEFQNYFFLKYTIRELNGKLLKLSWPSNMKINQAM